MGAWRITPGFHDILWNPAFTVPSAQLLGGAVRFWHYQLFCKPAKHGGVVAWHQDYSYWTRTVLIAHLTCWIALEDATIDNGRLHYIPGSHRWDLLPVTGLAGKMDSIRKVLSPEQLSVFEKPVSMELKKGTHEKDWTYSSEYTGYNGIIDPNANVQYEIPENLISGYESIIPKVKIGEAIFFDGKSVHRSLDNNSDIPYFTIVFRVFDYSNDLTLSSNWADIPYNRQSIGFPDINVSK